MFDDVLDNIFVIQYGALESMVIVLMTKTNKTVTKKRRRKVCHLVFSSQLPVVLRRKRWSGEEEIVCYWPIQESRFAWEMRMRADGAVEMEKKNVGDKKIKQSTTH